MKSALRSGLYLICAFAFGACSSVDRLDIPIDVPMVNTELLIVGIDGSESSDAVDRIRRLAGQLGQTTEYREDTKAAEIRRVVRDLQLSGRAIVLANPTFSLRGGSTVTASIHGSARSVLQVEVSTRAHEEFINVDTKLAFRGEEKTNRWGRLEFEGATLTFAPARLRAASSGADGEVLRVVGGRAVDPTRFELIVFAFPEAL